MAEKASDLPPAWAPFAGLAILVGAAAYLLVDFATHYVEPQTDQERTQWLVLVGAGALIGLVAGIYDLRRIVRRPAVSPPTQRPPLAIWGGIVVALIVAPLIGSIGSFDALTAMLLFAMGSALTGLPLLIASAVWRRAAYSRGRAAQGDPDQPSTR